VPFTAGADLAIPGRNSVLCVVEGAARRQAEASFSGPAARRRAAARQRPMRGNGGNLRCARYSA